jgi:hypothetical protein
LWLHLSQNFLPKSQSLGEQLSPALFLVLFRQHGALFLSKKLIMPKKERKPAMNEFLVGAAFVALVSTIVGLFFLYHARKQEEEFKKHVGQK